MCESYMRPLRLNLNQEEFDRLPRNPSWRYRYCDGLVVIDPAPVFRHAQLSLSHFRGATVEGLLVRPIEEIDWRSLIPIFARAFGKLEPFATLPDNIRLHAADQALLQTRSGGDGPIIEQASFTASLGNEIAGALLVTLLPLTDPEKQESYYWENPPPEDCVEKKLGQPHLTWVFVDPDLGMRGAGTTLLHHCATALGQLGFQDLYSTFILGNHVSMNWHWKCGFKPVAVKGIGAKNFSPLQ